PIGKAQLVISRQNEKAVVDSSGICFYAFMAFTLKEIRRMLVAATGLDYRSEHELELAGERIYNLTRLFNVREGFKARDDLLPRKFVEEPLPEGPAKGSTVPLRRMLEEYYALRGWDENGIPRRSKIVKLGLHELLPGVLDISAPG
ncbi:MAG: aldehyde ferredoxin oxidoreductase, partial [Thermoprotei archaeon]